MSSSAQVTPKQDELGTLGLGVHLRLFTLSHEFAHLLFHLGRAAHGGKKSDASAPTDTVAILLFSSAAFHLKARDKWISGSPRQRARRP